MSRDRFAAKKKYRDVNCNIHRTMLQQLQSQIRFSISILVIDLIPQKIFKLSDVREIILLLRSYYFSNCNSCALSSLVEDFRYQTQYSHLPVYQSERVVEV